MARKGKFQGLKKPNKNQNTGRGNKSLGSAPPVPGQQTGKRAPFGLGKGKAPAGKSRRM